MKPYLLALLESPQKGFLYIRFDEQKKRLKSLVQDLPVIKSYMAVYSHSWRFNM